MIPRVSVEELQAREKQDEMWARLQKQLESGDI